MIVLESEVVRLSLSLSLPPGIWNATRKLVGTREGGRREERRWWTEGRRRNRTRERREGCTVAPVHAPGAFHNPEYCSRIHIYATSPGDNSAIMRRGRARVQLELPSSRHQPPFLPTNSPPCDFHMPSPPSPDLSLPRRAWNCSESRTPGLLFLPSWFIQRCNGKNKGERVGSRSDREPNRLSRVLLAPKFLFARYAFRTWRRWNLLTAERWKFLLHRCARRRYCSQRCFVIYEALALGN